PPKRRPEACAPRPGPWPRPSAPAASDLGVVGSGPLVVLAEVGVARSGQHAAAVGLLLEPVGEELAVERRGVDAEDLARPLLLPAGVVEDLQDVFALELLQGQARRVDH